MATQSQIDRLRADVADEACNLDDDAIGDIFDEAAELYPDAALAQTAYARVIALRRLMAAAAKQSSYKQNASSEDLSDVYKNLESLLRIWNGELARAQAATGKGAAVFGKPRNKPARLQEYPGGLTHDH